MLFSLIEIGETSELSRILLCSYHDIEHCYKEILWCLNALKAPERRQLQWRFIPDQLEGRMFWETPFFCNHCKYYIITLESLYSEFWFHVILICEVNVRVHPCGYANWNDFMWSGFKDMK